MSLYKVLAYAVDKPGPDGFAVTFLLEDAKNPDRYIYRLRFFVDATKDFSNGFGTSFAVRLTASYVRVKESDFRQCLLQGLDAFLQEEMPPFVKELHEDLENFCLEDTNACMVREVIRLMYGVKLESFQLVKSVGVHPTEVN